MGHFDAREVNRSTVCGLPYRLRIRFQLVSFGAVRAGVSFGIDACALLLQQRHQTFYLNGAPDLLLLEICSCNFNSITFVLRSLPT